MSQTQQQQHPQQQQQQQQQQKAIGVDSNNILSNTPSGGNYLTLDGNTHNLTPYIQQVDMLLPHLSHAQREQLIYRFEQFYFSKYLKDPSPIPNLIFLIRNTNQHRNPYIQHFLLEQHGDVVTLENCIFPIPATPTHPSVHKPLPFFVNLYPEVMLHFLKRRPELIQCIDPSTNQSILHQYELDHRLLLFCYSQCPSLINHLDKNHRCPLHHRNQPHSFISLALTQNPNLYDLEDSHGNTVRSLLAIKHYNPDDAAQGDQANGENGNGGFILGTGLPKGRSSGRRHNNRSPYDGNNNNAGYINQNILHNAADGANNHFHHNNNNLNGNNQQPHRRRGGDGYYGNRNNTRHNSPYDNNLNANNNNFGNNHHHPNNNNHHHHNNNNNNHHHHNNNGNFNNNNDRNNNNFNHHHHNMNAVPATATTSSNASTTPQHQQQQQQQGFHGNNPNVPQQPPMQHMPHLAQHHYQPQYHPAQMVVLPQ